MEASLAYWIDPTKGMAFLKYRSQPEFPEWSEALGRLMEDPTFRPQYGLVFDGRDVARPAETSYVKRMVHFLDTKWASHSLGRCAVVVSDLGSYGMGRMAEQITDYENNLRTFQSMEEAMKWLSAGEYVPSSS